MATGSRCASAPTGDVRPVLNKTSWESTSSCTWGGGAGWSGGWGPGRSPLLTLLEQRRIKSKMARTSLRRSSTKRRRSFRSSGTRSSFRKSLQDGLMAAKEMNESIWRRMTFFLRKDGGRLSIEKAKQSVSPIKNCQQNRPLLLEALKVTRWNLAEQSEDPRQDPRQLSSCIPKSKEFIGYAKFICCLVTVNLSSYNRKYASPVWI